MTRIDPGQQLAALLRRQVAGLRKRPAPARPAAAQVSSRTAPDAASVAATRIQALSPDDPQRKQKALRIFLESVLLQELGPGLVQDPAFAQMVDAVQAQMGEDGEMAAAAQALGEILVAGG